MAWKYFDASPFMICTNINLSDQDEVSICSILVCLAGETLGDIQTPRILKAQEVFFKILCGPDATAG